jgi:Lecithin retinol acyltransferase
VDVDAGDRRSALRGWRRVHNWVRSNGSLFSRARLRAGDRRLVDSEVPPLGAHLVSPRFGFVHHGIYVGDGKVVHSGAVSVILPRGPVEEVPLSDFSRGHPIAVRGGEPARFTAHEIVARARSRAGENHYRLLTNNCEHFCEWCLRGRRRSYQVERLTRWIRPRDVISADDPRVLG